MTNCRCTKCQAKAAKKKKPKNVEEQPDEEVVVKQEEKEKPKTDSKVAEKEKPKTDSNKEEESEKKVKEKKEKKIVTWRHKSIRKEKISLSNNEQGHGNNFPSQQYNGFKQPYYRPRPMMHHAGSDPSTWWPMNPVPRGGYPAFTAPSAYGYGGPVHPYQHMARPGMFDGAYLTPHPPMPPYMYPRPDTNPVTRYTSYADNYSLPFYLMSIR